MSNKNIECILTLLKQVAADNTELKTQLAEQRDQISELKEMVAEVQSNDASAAKITEAAYRALNAKLDAVDSLDKKSSDALQKAAIPKTTKPCRPVFFKRIFAEDREKYIDVLYTQEELDKASATEKTTKSKTSLAISNHIATVLYNEYIKPNKERFAKFENIYTTEYP